MDKIFLYKIPTNQRNYSLCLQAVSQDKRNIRAVPYKYRTKELIKNIKHFNGIMKFLPYELKTHEICLDAIERNRFDLKYVPRKHKTHDLCLTTISNSTESYRYIPKIVKTNEFYLKAIEINHYVFIYVPDDQKTPELCKMFLEKDGDLIRYVPKNLLTKELCLVAINNIDSSILNLPIDIIEKYDLMPVLEKVERRPYENYVKNKGLFECI